MTGEENKMQQISWLNIDVNSGKFDLTTTSFVFVPYKCCTYVLSPGIDYTLYTGSSIQHSLGYSELIAHILCSIMAMV